MPRGWYHTIGCLLLICCGIGRLSAQSDSLLLTKNFQFTEGVYLSFQSFQANAPDMGWDSLDVTLVLNPQTHEARVATVVLEKEDGSRDSLNVRSFWGLCINGIPYIRLDDRAESAELTTFAAFRLRGKICYFSFRDIEEREVEVSAYNPRTGRPFRTGTVKREYVITRERMLDFVTGEVNDFTVPNFLTWIEDDPGLIASVLELPEDEQQDKLFRCLLIYVDRNPAFIRVKSKE